MKYLIGIIFCVLANYGFAQIEMGLSPGLLAIANRKNAETFPIDTLYTGRQKVEGVTVSPFQTVDFTISINTPGHKIFIIDSLEHILYTQAGKSGHYQYKTSQKTEGLDIYDLVDGKSYAVVGTDVRDQLNAHVEFGRHDVQINIKATLLPWKQDTINKHFVRFLKLGPILIDEPHFSFSLNKIPPPNFRTDPELNGITGEENLVTDEKTYKLAKRYIYDNKKYLRNDVIGVDHDSLKGWYKIVIDYKNVFYLKAENALSFIKGLEAHLDDENADKKVIGEMRRILF